MALLPNNQLVQVQTYQKAEIAWMLNSYAAIDWANKKFQNFQDREANLGDSVTFELAPRSSTIGGLIIQPQQTVQRFQTLVCSQAANSSATFSDQQFVFNVEQYMETFGKSRILELGTAIESDILQNIVSNVTVNNPEDPSFGQNISPDSGPYRFYGDGTTALNSIGQLAQMVANFKDYGAAMNDMRGILPMTIIPQIANTMLNQFVMDRNEDLAKSWMLGRYPGDCEWAQSNLLPIHNAGTVGNSAQTLTLISTNDPTGNNITQITLSGATPNDPNAIKAGDMLKINDGVGSLPNMRYLTFIGHKPSNQPVQIRALQNAAADGSGNVVINIYPALVSTPGLNQNLNNALQAGMQFFTLPSHRAGVLMSGNPFYLAMPRLPDQIQIPSVQTTDRDSGASIRHYWGVNFGQNQRLYVYDQIWGSTMVAENSMRIIIPLTQ